MNSNLQYFAFLFLFGCVSLDEEAQSSKTVFINDTELALSWIPAGSFTMGSSTFELYRKADEVQRTVKMTDGFWVGKTEVTVAQWEAVMGVNLRGQVRKVVNDERLYDFSGEQKRIRDFMNMDKNAAPETYLGNEYPDLPMHYVSWYDAIAFCEKLTVYAKEHNALPNDFIYNLPTETQWEYAYRASTQTATYAGDFIQDENGKTALMDTLGWYSGNSKENYLGKILMDSGSGSRRVKQLSPNNADLYDMAGNLWEWCLDWYGEYDLADTLNPKGLSFGVNKVNRGGSFGSWASSGRAANRAQNPPAEASAWRGFRVVLTKKIK